ncbi:MAG: copper chaperone PCu(A)C [Nitrospinota bacterium]
MDRIRIIGIAFVLFCFVFIGQSRAGGITVDGTWARATAPGAATGAAYMVVKNHGSKDDLLLSVKSSVAKRTEIHTVEMKGGMMDMHRVESVRVPAGGSAELKPGGYHVMMMGLKSPLKEGDTIHVTLKFKNAGEVEVVVPVSKTGKGMEMKSGGMDMNPCNPCNPCGGKGMKGM